MGERVSVSPLAKISVGEQIRQNFVIQPTSCSQRKEQPKPKLLCRCEHPILLHIQYFRRDDRVSRHVLSAVSNFAVQH